MEKLQSGQMIEWEDLDKKRYYTIGPSLFMCVRAVVYPFNLIKTRLFMQQQSSVYSGTFDAFRKILRQEGVRGLYKGYIVSSLGLLSGQLYITTYELIRGSLHGYRTEIKGLIAGFGATLVAQSVTVPVDIISQHMMVQGQVLPSMKGGNYIIVKNVDYIIPRENKVKLRGAVTILQDIVRKEGFPGLYRGYLVSMMTYAPNSALWWMFYSGFFRKNVEWGVAAVCPIWLVQVGCGVTSALLAATLTNPLDVVRTRYQLEDSKSVRATVKRLWREEGLRGMRKGLSARILANAPTSGILVLTYEWVKRLSLRTPHPPSPVADS